MRTTIHIPDDLLADAKKLAAELHTTLTSIIADALRERLARRGRRGKQRPSKLTTFGGKGLQPGVDLDDSASLIELMETSGATRRR